MTIRRNHPPPYGVEKEISIYPVDGLGDRNDNRGTALPSGSRLRGDSSLISIRHGDGYLLCILNTHEEMEVDNDLSQILNLVKKDGQDPSG